MTHSITIEIPLITVLDDQLCFVLTASRHPESILDIIGGRVEVDSDSNLDTSASRILRQYVSSERIHIEQLCAISQNATRPRSIAISYVALICQEELQQYDTSLIIKPINDFETLPLNHNEILTVAINRVRSKSNYSIFPAYFLPEYFTIPDLIRAYEVVRNESIDKAGFRRKILEVNALEEMPGMTVMGAPSRRPSQLYRIARGSGLFDRRL